MLHFGTPPTQSFYCGNFGCLLLDTAAASKVYPLLRKMAQITSMRGAQSAGIVTYTKRGLAKPIAKPTGSNRSRGFTCALPLPCPVNFPLALVLSSLPS